MQAIAAFENSLTKQERKAISGPVSPFKIQAFLDGIPYSGEERYRCPLNVLRDGKGHCFDGALFGAAMLRRLGHPPLILDMLPNDRDDDHLLALYKRDGHWGAVAKSNFSGLRFREPIYRTVRELVLSYFEQYFNAAGEKTLRSYTVPLNLKAFDKLDWMTSDENLEAVALRLDEIRKVPVLTRRMVAHLSPVDRRSYQAGMLGVNEAGLYKPPK